jgi:NDP-sugar pyrophosphorylase family protein
MDKEKRGIRAFVLCGGLGTRLRSVLSDRPKSMALVAGVPFLELLLRRLRAQGVTEVILGTGYKAEQIESYFGDGAQVGISIQYSRETEPLGTGGALKLAEPMLADPILVVNGDSYVELDLAKACDLLQNKDADLVMVLQQVPEVDRYGSVRIDTSKHIVEFVEKGNRTGEGLINAGVYLLRKKILEQIPSGKAVSLEREMFPGLLAGKVYGLVAGGTFIDIGVPADLERAQTLLAPQAQK